MLSAARPVVLFWVVSFCAVGVTAAGSDLYFFVEKNAARCFYEQVPESSILIGHYDHPDHLEAPLVVTIDEIDQDNDQSRLRTIECSSHGKFAFTSSHGPSEYKICISNELINSWPTDKLKTRFHLQTELGGVRMNSLDEASSASDADVWRVRESLENLVELTGRVNRALELSVKQQHHFNAQSSALNMRVLVWIAAHVVFLVAGYVVQTQSLRRHFARIMY